MYKFTCSISRFRSALILAEKVKNLGLNIFYFKRKWIGRRKKCDISPLQKLKTLSPIRIITAQRWKEQIIRGDPFDIQGCIGLFLTTAVVQNFHEKKKFCSEFSRKKILHLKPSAVVGIAKFWKKSIDWPLFTSNAILSLYH